MATFMKMQSIYTLVASLVIMIGAELAGSSLTLAFSKGYSMKLAQTIKEYHDPNPFKIKLGLWMIMAQVSFMQILILTELICYIRIYVELYRNDHRLGPKALGKATMLRRKKRNAISLYGQVITFIMEIGVAILVLLMFQLKIVFFDESLYTFILIGATSTISVTHICSSGELRRHYFKGSV